ncbi:MAG: MqnA/MqnD/SBP family protein [Ginsengibacter sp.]
MKILLVITNQKYPEQKPGYKLETALFSKEKFLLLFMTSVKNGKVYRLPFVFAAWISDKKLDDDFINHFNDANAFGLNKIDEVVNQNPYEVFDLHHYYTDCISFEMDEKKKKGLELFLEKLVP